VAPVVSQRFAPGPDTSFHPESSWFTKTTFCSSGRARVCFHTISEPFGDFGRTKPTPDFWFWKRYADVIPMSEVISALHSDAFAS